LNATTYFAITRVMWYICYWKRYSSTQNFPSYFTGKKSPNITFISHISLCLATYYALKKKFLFYSLSVYVDMSLKRKEKDIEACATKNSTRNSGLDRFNSASVWLFILSIEIFFSRWRVKRFFFLYTSTFAQTNSGRVFYERTRSFSFQNFARSSVCLTRYSVRS